MIGLLAARLGLDFGKISGRAIILVALSCVIALAVWRGLTSIETMVEVARSEARRERDAWWQGQIAKANAEAEGERARLAVNAAVADGLAQDEISRLQAALNRTEKDNAALPGAGACGVDRERVRLLAR